MHPTASTMHPQAPHDPGYKYGGLRAPRSRCGVRGLWPASRSPPGPQGPHLLPGSRHPSSVRPGEHPRIQEPPSFSRDTAPLLWPPQSSGVTILASEPSPTPPASLTGHPEAQEPWCFAHASSLFFGDASLPLCGEPAGVGPVLASARGSGSARGGRLASGGVRPLAAG